MESQQSVTLRTHTGGTTPKITAKSQRSSQSRRGVACGQLAHTTLPASHHPLGVATGMIRIEVNQGCSWFLLRD
ncbi:hypothetical protein Hamer_G023664 [Homarus americanus]|uniref:Uncharacterized protein n=1 Tax=Homarus americanus TaxID=6706 RepID=A0A8J5MK93_HOMAM|nr:hypothetical protein Hamer_G023664 [Homarus americanus]